MLTRPIALNLKYKPQLLVGLGIGVWLYLFLVLIGPFDSGELSLRIRTILMIGYGLVFFGSYALLIPFQNWLYGRWGKWTLRNELALVSFFCIYSLPLIYLYYKTDLVNGDYSFFDFSLLIYCPTITILIPVIVAGRYFVAYLMRKNDENNLSEATVTLVGDNKLDILKLSISDLVALEAANNYVAVHYLIDGQLQKKLLRNSLRKMQASVPEMVQVHRSYLVNPRHFIEWKDGSTLGLTQKTVPVSQKYKASLLDMNAFVPK